MNYKENPIATTLACIALGLFFWRVNRMVYLAIAVICAVIALEVGLRIGQYNYVSRKEIDQIRAMRGW